MLPIPISRPTAAFLAFSALPGSCAGCTAEVASTPETPSASPSLRVSWLGESRLPTGLRFADTEVGGLSALVYDPSRGVFLALSDDRGTKSSRGPARLYELEIGLESLGGAITGSRKAESPDPSASTGEISKSGAATRVEMRITGVTVLRERDGTPFAPGTLDPEGLALTPDGTVLVASEGDASRGVAPFVRELDRAGRTLRSFAVPDAYLPGDGVGVRANRGFEALTRTPDFSAVVTATENALFQDGPETDLEQGSPSRILRFEPATGRPVAEYLYPTEPVAVPPLLPGGRRDAGLVELLALDGSRFLALERSYSEGMGVTVRLFEVSLDGATEITGSAAVDPKRVRPVKKRLVADLTELGIVLDNLEAMSWGPALPDGRCSLLMLSDNNFNVLQTTQLLVFAVEPCP